MSKFYEKFDRKRFLLVFKITLILLFLVIIFNLINVAYSRYESSGDTEVSANVAFFVIDAGTYQNSISLSGLVPSNNAYNYSFNVYNYKNDRRTKVKLNYSINFTTTTNLPLSFEIRRNSETTNIINSDTYIQNSDDMYFRQMLTSNTYELPFNVNQVDTYNLIVNFPLSYQNNPDAYQGLIDTFTITIVAQQVI